MNVIQIRLLPSSHTPYILPVLQEGGTSKKKTDRRKKAKGSADGSPQYLAPLETDDDELKQLRQIQKIAFYQEDYELKDVATIKSNFLTSKNPADLKLWVTFCKQSAVGVDNPPRNSNIMATVCQLVQEGSGPILVEYLVMQRERLSRPLPEEPLELEREQLWRYLCSEFEARIQKTSSTA